MPNAFDDAMMGKKTQKVTKIKIKAPKVTAKKNIKSIKMPKVTKIPKIKEELDLITTIADRHEVRDAEVIPNSLSEQVTDLALQVDLMRKQMQGSMLFASLKDSITPFISEKTTDMQLKLEKELEEKIDNLTEKIEQLKSSTNTVSSADYNSINPKSKVLSLDINQVFEHIKNLKSYSADKINYKITKQKAGNMGYTKNILDDFFHCLKEIEESLD